MKDSIAYKIVENLCHLNRNFCSGDYETALSYLQKILPFKIDTFTSSDEFNGWEIPPKWDLIHATIRFKGQVLWEAKHPLEVIGLSTPFQGKVNRDELRRHLHYDRRDPHSIPYHFRQNYRPWERTWGFCVTQEFYDQLSEGEYEVRIETRETEGYLKVASVTKEGEHPETFAFVAHLDHPGMANDDLAGVAVGVELFKRLWDKPCKFSYRLVLVQEMIGSIYYLGKRQNERRPILESCFLEMLGSKTPFALQHTREGKTLLEKELERTLQEEGCHYQEGAFRSIICNDEPIWESYGIPMASLSRFPYPEYHSDKDNLSIISPESLDESVRIFEKLIEKLDQATLMRKHFEGVLSLSHPSYNLYVDPGQPAFGDIVTEKVKSLRLAMDLMPMYPKQIFIDQIADEVDLSKEDLLEYLRLWENKKIISLI
jgi:aminopeptidase-like protein